MAQIERHLQERSIPSAATNSPDGAVVRQLAERLHELRDRTIKEVGRVVVGMEAVTHQFLIALLAGGHVLLEGVPGVAKTTLSKIFARILGVEQEGVYRLPEAQLDRFLLRVEMGYPGHSGEVEMLKLHSRPVDEVAQVFTGELILEMQQQLADVHGNEALLHYIVDLAEASRHHADLMLGASPRASLCLLRCARARALLDGRHYFTHADVHAVALGVLGHRLIIRPEAEVEGKRVADVIQELVNSVPVLETAK